MADAMKRAQTLYRRKFEKINQELFEDQVDAICSLCGLELYELVYFYTQGVNHLGILEKYGFNANDLP